jgi:uncharacterized protein
MKTVVSMIIGFSFLIPARAATAQGIQVNRENRTVAVSASATVESDPEFAVIHIGYLNYAATKDAAVDENVRVTSKIIDAILASGLKKTDIATEDLGLRQPDSGNGDSTVEERQGKRFEASQQWAITVRPADAQGVLDRAIAAGANDLQGVTWDVGNPSALDAKAASLALDKARDLAGQLAQQSGGKVGQLLFVSNTQPGSISWFGNGGYGQSVTVEANIAPSFRLFPRKVSRQVTIYAAFALE